MEMLECPKTTRSADSMETGFPSIDIEKDLVVVQNVT
jgi:hypothetical protein